MDYKNEQQTCNRWISLNTAPQDVEVSPHGYLTFQRSGIHPGE